MMVTACASRTCDCEMLCHSGLNSRCQHLFSRSVSRLYERASLPVNGQPYLVSGLCNCAHATPPFPGAHFEMCANCPYPFRAQQCLTQNRDTFPPARQTPSSMHVRSTGPLN